jgi:dihydroflavonol-4-reductase
MKDATLSESYWNETSTTVENPYGYSKVAAEREAWKIQGAQTRWDLVVINPGMVLGPSLTPQSASGSLFLLENMYRGDNKMGAPELQYPIADVREVAEAHVQAGENVAARGRYIIASDRSVSLLEMAGFVRPVHKQPKLLPSRNLPKLLVYAAGPFIGVSRHWVSTNIGIGYRVDNSKSIRELGIKYRPMNEVVQSHYQSWLNNNSATK